MVEVLADSPEKIIDIPELNWNVDEFPKFARSFDSERDILFVHKSPKPAAISLDVGGHLWIRYIPVTGEVVGLEIEDFEAVFLARYPELHLSWEKVKPFITKQSKGRTIADYIKLLVLFVQDIWREHPHQRQLVMS